MQSTLLHEGGYDATRDADSYTPSPEKLPERAESDRPVRQVLPKNGYGSGRCHLFVVGAEREDAGPSVQGRRLGARSGNMTAAYEHDGKPGLWAEIPLLLGSPSNARSMPTKIKRRSLRKTLVNALLPMEQL